MTTGFLNIAGTEKDPAFENPLSIVKCIFDDLKSDLVSIIFVFPKKHLNLAKIISAALRASQVICELHENFIVYRDAYIAFRRELFVCEQLHSGRS